jgi:peptidoglycan/LPS O-acetylase OafA/YrhL
VNVSLDLKARIRELDGIRGIAIGMVLIWHFFVVTNTAAPGSPLAHGLVLGRLTWTGVDLFFVLSGFLIGGILLDARDSSNYFRVFYTRRFYRIVPVYALCLVSVFGFIAIIRFGRARDFSWMADDQLPWLPYVLFLQNFWMATRNSLGSFGLGATWSLAVEEQFYMTLPLLVRVLDRRRLPVALGVGIIGAPVIRLMLHAFWPNQATSWTVLMPCRADALLLGVIGALAVREPRWRGWLVAHRRSFWIAFVTLLSGLGLLTLKASMPGKFLMLSVGFTWQAFFYLLVILYAVLFRNSVLSRCLRWRWLGWLGTIAYGVYLLHEFVYGAFFGLIWSRPPVLQTPANAGVAVLAIASTLVICRLSWNYFEKPLVRLGHREDYLSEKGEATAVGGFLSPKRVSS